LNEGARTDPPISAVRAIANHNRPVTSEAEVTKIERPPNGVEEVPVMLSRLLEAHELILGEIRVAITKTAANRDDGTNDLLMSEVLRTNESQVWFIAEHLVDTPLVRS
jgi:starvation-inducible DNA-binding protein